MARLFIVSAPEDRELAEELLASLRPLQNERSYEVTLGDSLLRTGHSLEDLLAEVRKADVVLVLVSPDLFASEKAWPVVTAVLARAESSDASAGAPRARIFPILLRPSSWEEGPLAGFAPLPASELAVVSFPDRSEAWGEVGRELEKIARTFERAQEAMMNPLATSLFDLSKEPEKKSDTSFPVAAEPFDFPGLTRGVSPSAAMAPKGLVLEKFVPASSPPVVPAPGSASPAPRPTTIAPVANPNAGAEPEPELVSRALSLGSDDVAEQAPREPRHVNAWLVAAQGGQPLDLREPLQRRAPYLLHVDIGPRAEQSAIVNAAPIPAEALRTLFEKGGDHLMVAVYSHDFHLAAEGGPPHYRRGHAVMQRLWLGPSGKTEALFFRVEPRRAGLVYLRICVYYKNQLLQSIRLEARAVRRRGDAPVLRDLPGLAPAQERALVAAQIGSLEKLASAEVLAETVAGATGVSVEKAEDWKDMAGRAGKLGYEALVEYTIDPDFSALSRLPSRAVAFFTNYVNATHVVGVKVGDWDAELGKGDDWTDSLVISEEVVGTLTSAMRATLDSLSFQQAMGQDFYLYASDDDATSTPAVRANQGSEEGLKEGLAKLARQGSELFGNLLPAEMQRALDQTLAEPGQTIHVARVADGTSLPWAAVYQPPLDLTAPTLEVCLDLQKKLDDKGRPDYHACSGQATCPLKGDKAETTVCPWGFWGYKHHIEQPAQRIVQGAEPRSLATVIDVPARPRISMSVNALLSRVDAHRQRVEKLAGAELLVNGDDRKAPAEDPDLALKEVRAALTRSDLHLVYFYCHGGAAPGPSGLPLPYLSLGSDNVPARPKRLLPNELATWLRKKAGKEPLWPARPLVLINGCQTAGLEPRLLASFVQRFAELGASGVIGTEVRVAEPLACAVAERFFEELLAGEKVGDIFRRIRLDLLLRNNPLGLVYTLYCSADLHLSRGPAA